MGHTADVVEIGLAAMAILWSFCAGLGGRLSIRTTYRLVIMIGSVVLIAGSAFLVLMSSTANVSLIIAGAVIIGMGLGFVSSTYIVAVQTNVNWKIRGSATSTIHFARMFGQALGAALFGMVINLNLRADGVNITNVDTIMDPVRREQLDASVRDPLIATLGEALTDVYVITGIIAVLALAVAAFMPRGLNPGTSLGSQSPG